MQPPKRQIIKIRPQRHYIVARVALLIIALIAILVAMLLIAKPHAAHAAALPALPALLQEAPFAGRTAPIKV